MTHPKLSSLLAASLLALCSWTHAADVYPTKPIRLLVGFSAGMRATSVVIGTTVARGRTTGGYIESSSTRGTNWSGTR